MLRRNKILLFSGLMLTAVFSLGCNNNKGSDGGAAAAPAAGAGTYGVVGGACGRVDADLQSYNRDAACRFLSTDPNSNCQKYRPPTGLRVAGRIYLRPLRDATGNVAESQVLTERAPGVGNNEKSIITVTVVDNGSTQEITLPLKSTGSNSANGGRVDLTFEDDKGSLQIIGTFTSDTTSGQLRGRSTNNDFETLGSFSIKSCGIFLPGQ